MSNHPPHVGQQMKCSASFDGLPSIISPMNLPRGMSLIGKSNQAIGSISAGSLSMIGEAVARPANL